MIHLQATQTLRSALGVGNLRLDIAQATDSLLGNWFVDIARMGDRHAFVFMSARSLLSFPIMIGSRPPSVEDLPVFLRHGMAQMFDHLETPRDAVTSLMKDLEQVVLCRATDRSLLATMQPVVAGYERVRDDDGQAVDLGRVIARINEQPRATLGYRSAFDVSRELLQAAAA